MTRPPMRHQLQLISTLLLALLTALCLTTTSSSPTRIYPSNPKLPTTTSPLQLTSSTTPSPAAPYAVRSFGSAPDYGSLAGRHLNAPVVGMAKISAGYYEVASDGGVFAFGAAKYYGSMANRHLNAPIVGITATSTGYWLVASDGGIFAFGTAKYYGSMATHHLNAPIVGIASTSTGYWLVASDGGVFAFGTAKFHGSMASRHLNAPIVGIASTSTGYRLVASDGGVFCFGDAHYLGSLASAHLSSQTVGIASTTSANGYLLATSTGAVYPFGSAVSYGNATVQANAITVGISATTAGYYLVFGLTNPLPSVISNYLLTRSDQVGVAVIDLNTGQQTLVNPNYRGVTASIVKVNILATLLNQLQAQDASLSQTDQYLATTMIENSNNDSATSLFNAVGGAPALANLDTQIAMTETTPNVDWGLTTTSPLDQTKLLRTLVFSNSLLDNSSRNYELNLMRNVESDQHWGVSAGPSPTITVPLKNGWLPIGNYNWQINSIGWVDGAGRNYLIAVMSDANPTMSYGVQSIESISNLVWQDLATP